MHETARVSTPEADVPVPPPPAQEEVTAAAGIRQDHDIKPTEWWQTPAGKALGVVVAVVAVLVVLVNLDAGVAIMLVTIGGLVAFALYNRRGGRTVDAAGRRVLRAGYSEPISEAERSRELEEEISQYTGRGFFVRQRTATTAQLMRPKRFSFVWALLWFLVFGIGLVVYLIYYAAKQDQGRYLEVDEYGTVKATRQIRHAL